MTTLPKGYVSGAQLANGNSERLLVGVDHPLVEALSKPVTYKKARAAKHDENNRRPPRHAGQKKVCQCCYRSGYSILDLVCKRCLKDRHDLAILEKEIAEKYPATASMTSAEIFRKLWGMCVTLNAQKRKLKAEVERLKQRRRESASDLIGD